MSKKNKTLNQTTTIATKVIMSTSNIKSTEKKSPNVNALTKRNTRSKTDDSESDALNIQQVSNTMQLDIAEIKKMMGELKQTTKEETSEFKKTVDLLLKRVNELLEEGKIKDKQIDALEERLNIMEQQTLCRNAEIINAPTEKDPITTIIEIAEASHFKLEENEIEDAYRTKNNKKLIVKFFSTKTKRKLMKQIKEVRLTNNNLKTNPVDKVNKKIYVNDELTAKNRKLLFDTKANGKLLNWKYIWVKNGRILGKKDETSRVIHINKVSDLYLNV